MKRYRVIRGFKFSAIYAEIEFKEGQIWEYTTKSFGKNLLRKDFVIAEINDFLLNDHFEEVECMVEVI